MISNGVVKINQPIAPSKFDWSSIYFMSSHLYDTTAIDAHLSYSDAKIVSLQNELQRIANLIATNQTILKYPDWPYRSNKRAENYLYKMEKANLKNGPTGICESIEKLCNGTFRIVIDTAKYLDHDSRALQLFSLYDGYSIFQQFGSPVFVNTKINMVNYKEEDQI